MTEQMQHTMPEPKAMAPGAVDVDKRQGLAAAGGILGAIAASSCCIVPLLLTVAGVSGAWMANLRALAPYQPIFIGITALFVAYGFYLVYWRPRRVAARGAAALGAGVDGEACAACARPAVPSAVVKSALWLAAVMVLLAATFPIWFFWIEPYLP